MALGFQNLARILPAMEIHCRCWQAHTAGLLHFVRKDGSRSEVYFRFRQRSSCSHALFVIANEVKQSRPPFRNGLPRPRLATKEVERWLSPSLQAKPSSAPPRRRRGCAQAACAQDRVVHWLDRRNPNGLIIDLDQGPASDGCLNLAVEYSRAVPKPEYNP